MDGDVMKMFEEMADEIFLEARCDKTKVPWVWDDCVAILSQKMAMLSAIMGLSKRRVTAFNKQRKSLVDDLIKMKEEHPEISLGVP